MKHEEMIAVIEAHKNGKKLQVRRRLSDNTWILSSTPSWDFSVFDYRVKPEPRECWVTVSRDSNFSKHDTPVVYTTKQLAVDSCPNFREIVHMREVIEK